MCDCLVINTNHGIVKGSSSKDLNGKVYHRFLGIPYAKPPLGHLRFKAPQPVDKWDKIRDAMKDCNACFHRDIFTRQLVGSEDCLYLNVFTPQVCKNVKSNALRPVMVWIHGGGFISGSNRSDINGPEFLVAENVVLVTINYRFGVLGFLSLEDSKLGVPGNAGCKDMVMALKWVQGNIGYFGGSPKNVTIFGESAGAAAVHFLMLSPMGKGLFHKVIAQSGSALNPWALARPSVRELVEVLECPYTEESEILEYLQEIPVEKLFEGQEKLRDEHSAYFVRPIGIIIEKVSQEPAFLVQDPVVLLKHKKYYDLPVMFGYNSCEGLLFLAIQRHLKKDKLIEDFEDMLPNTLKLERGTDQSKWIANRIKNFYFEKNMVDDSVACVLQTDNFFLRGIYESARLQAANSKQPVYFYRFSVDGRLNFNKMIAKINSPGACHADELGYLFNTFITPDNLDSDSIESKTIRRMTKLWTNFARTGNPNPIDEVEWKPIVIIQNEINFLDIGNELKCDVNPEKERMDFWDEIENSIN